MKLKARTFALVTFLMPVAALPAIAATNHSSLLGSSAPSSAATRQIRINPETKYVNVQGGDVVTFNVGDKAFTWHFNGVREIGSFDLSDVAPAGILVHPVIVYVSPDPQWLGG